MVKLFLKPQALQDLELIYEYTVENWGFDQADKYQDDLEKGLSHIIANQEIGKIYKYKKGGYRYYHVNKHLIFYRSEEMRILVVRILHERIKLSDNL